MGRGFARTGAQVEEDLKNRVSTADQEYAKQVQATNALRQELLGAQRPQAVKALKDLIYECDAALTLQLQKFGIYYPHIIHFNPFSNLWIFEWQPL